MEEILDFDEFVKNQPSKDIKYWAVFAAETGEVQGIYPNNSADHYFDKIEISKDLAESIIEGTVQLSSCFVDITNDKLEIIETQSLRKIDDILHRVIDVKWSNASDADIDIKYFKKTKKMKVSMTDRFYGTTKSKASNSKRKIDWKGSTEMLLLITDYNDPNMLYYTLSLKITDLIGKDVIFKNIQVPQKFSIYTRRIFKNYVMSIQ